MAAKASLAYTAWDTAAALSGPWLEAIHLGTVLRLAEGETLYEQNDIHDYFYLVRAGFVHTSLLRSNGAQLLVEIFGPKAIFGEAPAFSGLPRSVAARAVTPCVVSRYLPSEVAPAMQQQPELAHSMLKLMGFKTHFLLRKLSRFASSDPQERVLEFLARMARLDTAPSDAAQPIAIELTHEQIASMVALTRVTVTRTLKVLTQRGLIETESRRVVVRDHTALLALLDTK